jgi:hypothetical protein
MANSAHTTALEPFERQVGRVGKQATVSATITFGSDYAAAVLPLITADELGLSVVNRVVVESAAAGTAHGATVVVAITSGGPSFTLALFNGTTAVGTVDESLTTVPITVYGN